MHKKLSQYAVVLIFFVFIANLAAYKFYWYSSIWWYDMLMHTLGGVFLALLAGVMARKAMQREHRGETIVSILIFVLVLSVGWEIFEYIVQVLIKPEPFVNIPDTISDLVCDMVGGTIGVFFVLRAKKRYNSTHEPIKNA